MTRDEWLECRRKLITASDAPIIMGVSKWCSPYTLWARKLGLVPDQEETEIMRFGREQEHYILARWMEETGRCAVLNEPYTLTYSKTFPWMAATIDAWEGDNPVECKMVLPFMAADWRFGIPEYVRVQAQHQMMVTGSAAMCVAAYVIGEGPRYMDVPLSNSSAELIETEERFLECLRTETPPPIDGSESTRETLKGTHEETEPEPIPLPDHLIDIDIRREEIQAQLKELSKEKEQLDNEIMAALDAHEVGHLPQCKYTFKWQDKAGYTVAPSRARVLRRAKT